MIALFDPTQVVILWKLWHPLSLRHLRQLVQEECLIHDELFELFSEPILFCTFICIFKIAIWHQWLFLDYDTNEIW